MPYPSQVRGRGRCVALLEDPEPKRKRVVSSSSESLGEDGIRLARLSRVRGSRMPEVVAVEDPAFGATIADALIVEATVATTMVTFFGGSLFLPSQLCCLHVCLLPLLHPWPLIPVS